MKKLFDTYSAQASKNVTKYYSTSFYTAVCALDKNIRKDIHNIYGFVRLADEIVDSFHGYVKATLLMELERLVTHRNMIRDIIHAPSCVFMNQPIRAALIRETLNHTNAIDHCLDGC